MFVNKKFLLSFPASVLPVSSHYPTFVGEKYGVLCLVVNQ